MTPVAVGDRVVVSIRRKSYTGTVTFVGRVMTTVRLDTAHPEYGEDVTRYNHEVFAAEVDAT